MKTLIQEGWGGTPSNKLLGDADAMVHGPRFRSLYSAHAIRVVVPGPPKHDIKPELTEKFPFPPRDHVDTST